MDGYKFRYQSATVQEKELNQRIKINDNEVQLLKDKIIKLTDKNIK